MSTISFGQAILLLVDYYKEQNSVTDYLKKLYIRGISSKEDFQRVMELFADSKLATHYEVSTEANVIDEDPSRRYFETHLAFETLLFSLDKLFLPDLNAHYKALYSMIPEDKRIKFDAYVANSISPGDDNFATEYTDAFEKIKSNDSYQRLSPDKKDTLTLILKCSWLGVMLAKSPLPLNIYRTGFFSEKERGRIAKPSAFSLMSDEFAKKLPYYSKHFGLMKNYMPVPRSDVIFTEKGFGFVKPSDQNTFNPAAEWPKKNFSTLVNPFSCAISGTTLCQLRSMKQLHNDGQMNFDSLEKLTLFLRNFTSALLFNSGGHSYNEFLGVLEIPEVRKSFDFIDGFNTINARTLLLDDNEAAFNQALKNTIEYTKVVLAKQEFHDLLTLGVHGL